MRDFLIHLQTLVSFCSALTLLSSFGDNLASVHLSQNFPSSLVPEATVMESEERRQQAVLTSMP